MKFFLYKARKSLISCFCLTISIGFIYAFSLFSPHLMSELNISKNAVQFAFCLNIFFLGMGAAFFGSLVERNIKKAAWLSTILLFLGLCVSSISVHLKNVWLLYTGLGILCGLAEGVGYVTPVKNLLLFFGKSKHKALIMAISIVSFGLGSSVCSYIFKVMFPYFGIRNIFFVLAGIYLPLMAVSAYLIDKPRFAKLKISASNAKSYSPIKYLCDSYFRKCWVFMFLNISMGLLIIGQCAGLLSANSVSNDMVIVIMMLCGLSNGFGRLFFPAIGDYMRKKIDCWCIALILEIVVLCLVLTGSWFISIAVIVINACYGCGFAILPAVLLEKYNKSELSFIHGLCLSAWGFASLFAFIVSIFTFSVFHISQFTFFILLICIYSLNLINVLTTKPNDNVLNSI